MRLRNWMTLAIATLTFGTACEEKKPAVESEEVTTSERETPPPSTEPLAPTEGKFSIGKLDVKPSVGVFKAEGAPKPEEVQARLEAKLYESDAFEKGGPRELSGSVMYDIRKTDDGWDVMLGGGVGSPNARFQAGVGQKSTGEGNADKSVAELVNGSVDEMAKQIARQAGVLASDVDGLVAVLEREGAEADEKIVAIQELRERRAKEAIPSLRKQLDPENPSNLRTAAAATLVQLGDTESRNEIVRVAEDLSRDKDPQYVPMLHILADLGGQEVETYLRTVADAHPAPAVRAVASEALRELEATK